MNPLTQSALSWLLDQPDFSIYRDGIRCCVTVAGQAFRDRNTEDAICAAWEQIHEEPRLREARADIAAEERDLLPDYQNPID